MASANDYLAEDGGPTLERLIQDRNLVPLATGSPELEYSIRIELGAIARPLRDRWRASTRFVLVIRGGELVVYDTYALLDGLDAHAESCVRFAVPDAAYDVEAGWSEGTKDGSMDLDLLLTETREPSAPFAQGSAPPSLIYSSRR